MTSDDLGWWVCAATSVAGSVVSRVLLHTGSRSRGHESKVESDDSLHRELVHLEEVKVTGQHSVRLTWKVRPPSEDGEEPVFICDKPDVHCSVLCPVQFQHRQLVWSEISAMSDSSQHRFPRSLNGRCQKNTDTIHSFSSGPIELWPGRCHPLLIFH